MLRLFALLLLLAPAALWAQPVPERYSEVRLLVSAASGLLDRLALFGVGLDHGLRETTDRGTALRVVLSETELAQVRAAGVEVDVLVEDLAAHYLATRQGTCEGGSAVSRITADLCGTMGGYPTFSAIVAHLDTLHARYPGLVSARASLGQSREGRDVWMVEISDNPGVDEGEPEALYTALHHAREPGSMMAVLYFMYYVAEQYGTNPDVTALLDGRRLFFVPVVNPDGYVYNEQTDPNGGGFWRKNRRDNGDGTFGVDLNRNYGYQWGYDNSGSSPNPWSETYRGPAPFSEPETAALRDFFEDGRAIRTAFNYHTYGDLLLFAWAYDDLLTPDHNVFVAASRRLTADNGYEYGPSPQVLYPSNGNANDWMYGEQATKPKVFSFTPEVGPSFWPPSSQIVPLAVENLRANLLLMQFAGLAPAITTAMEDPLAEASAPADAPALESASPNPFTSVTTVAFTLPEAGAVRLAVYDVLGREAAVLAAGERAAGRHEVVFDASGLAAGVYVVRLAVGPFSATRQVVVAR